MKRAAYFGYGYACAQVAQRAVREVKFLFENSIRPYLLHRCLYGGKISRIRQDAISTLVFQSFQA
ncbi:MAG TPA: hypothetical protein VFB14_27875 [Bryobacteraceae bacterium]|nr:hypothetical protein [Bryobacteraceae bacterium]